MAFATKRRLVVGFLVAVALWPALQHAFVMKSGGNPWHFFGMSMYCVPHEVVGLQFGQVVDGQIQGMREGSVTPELERRLSRYRLLYQAVGVYAPLEGIDEVLARIASPGAESVVLRPRHLVLDLETARVESVERTLIFPVAAR